jgi:hypothetical protein
MRTAIILEAMISIICSGWVQYEHSASSCPDANAMGTNSKSVLRWDWITGWVRLETPGKADLSLCWLPAERRGHITHVSWAIRGYSLAFGAVSGAVTILDFSEMLASVGDIQTA